jgi:hypothetical protein
MSSAPAMRPEAPRSHAIAMVRRRRAGIQPWARRSIRAIGSRASRRDLSGVEPRTVRRRVDPEASGVVELTISTTSGILKPSLLGPLGHDLSTASRKGEVGLGASRTPNH